MDKGIIVSFACLHDIAGKNLIQGSPRFSSQAISAELLDYGAYSRAEYNLAPIMDRMKGMDAQQAYPPAPAATTTAAEADDFVN